MQRKGVEVRPNPKWRVISVRFSDAGTVSWNVIPARSTRVKGRHRVPIDLLPGSDGMPVVRSRFADERRIHRAFRHCDAIIHPKIGGVWRHEGELFHANIQI